jgi:low affinity Fe/Cu permease
VFLIQNTQNRDAKALHLKLDELIRTLRGARNDLIDLEDCTDEELETLQREFTKLRNGRSTRGSEQRRTLEAQQRIGRPRNHK